jgi:hypothetical protein
VRGESQGRDLVANERCAGACGTQLVDSAGDRPRAAGTRPCLPRIEQLDEFGPSAISSRRLERAANAANDRTCGIATIEQFGCKSSNGVARLERLHDRSERGQFFGGREPRLRMGWTGRFERA